MLVGIPKNEVFLSKGLPPLHTGDVGVSILLHTFCCRNLPDRHQKSHFGGQTTILEDKLLTFSEAFTFFDYV